MCPTPWIQHTRLLAPTHSPPHPHRPYFTIHDASFGPLSKGALPTDPPHLLPPTTTTTRMGEGTVSMDGVGQYAAHSNASIGGWWILVLGCFTL